MKKIPITEKANPSTKDIDLMDSYQIAKAINKEDKKVALAVEKELKEIAKAIEFISDSFLKGGRLAYFGAGTSGRLGILDASECWPTFGVEHGMVQGFIAGGDKALRFSIENAEDNESFAKKDLKKFKPTDKDIVVGISAGGCPKYVITVLNEAQKKGVKTIGISSNPNAKIKEFSDIFINPIVGEEVITGSSRMKSGTAQKMVLNILSTGSMIHIGKTYHNYMVDVRACNEKLEDRACRIVCEVAGVCEIEAKKCLEKSGKKVRLACIIANRKCSLREAEKLLTQAKGILRKII